MIPALTLTGTQVNGRSQSRGRETEFVFAQSLRVLQACPVWPLVLQVATGCTASGCLIASWTFLIPVAIWVWNSYNLTIV